MLHFFIKLFLLLVLIIQLVGCSLQESNQTKNTVWGNLAIDYKFDESSGSVAVNSASPKPSDSEGDIFYCSRTSGKVNNCLYFNMNGSGVRLYSYGPLPSGQISIDAWIKPTKLNLGTIYTIFSHSQGSYEGLSIKDKKLNFTFNGNTILISSSEIQINIWTHIAVTSDGTYIKIYLNGIEDCLLNLTLSLGSSNVFPAWVGCYENSFVFNNEFKGYIDEFRIWRIGLSSQEILDYYNLTK
jgi:hypothetical protein